MKQTIQYIQFMMPLSVAKSPLIFYITEHFETPQMMVYSSFVKYLLKEFNINDRKGIIKELDSYRNIFLDNLTGEFQIIQDEITTKKVTHKEMLKLNQEQKIESWVEKGLNRLHTQVNNFRSNFNVGTNSNRRK